MYYRVSKDLSCELKARNAESFPRWEPKGTIVPTCKGNIFSLFLSQDICFVTSWQWRQLLRKEKKYNGAAIVNTDTVRPLTITEASMKRFQFSRRPNKQACRAKERACKASACKNFDQAKRPWEWLTKWWGKKNTSIAKEACQFPVTMTRPEKDQAALCLQCKENKIGTNLRPLVC